MAQTIGSVIIDVQADTQKLVKGFDNAQNKVKSATASMKKAIAGLAAAYISIQSVTAFKGMIQGSIDAADSVGKLSEKLGISASALSGLQYAAGFADVSIGQLNASMSAMIRRTENFKRDGGGAAKNALTELGITAEFARKNFTDTETTFKLLIDRLAELPEGTKKTAIAQDLFSKSAADVVRLTAMGADGIDDLVKKGKELGVVFTDELARNSAIFNDTLLELSQVSTGMSNNIATGLIPVLNIMARDLVEFSSNIETSSASVQNFAIVAYAAMTKTADTINFLYESIENSAQAVVYTINTVVYGALRGITGLAAKSTQALNVVGLSSDETLASIEATFQAMDRQYNIATSGIKGSVTEISEAMTKMNVSLDDRIKMLQDEIKLSKEKAEIDGKNKVEEDKERNKLLQQRLNLLRQEKESEKDEKSNASAIKEKEALQAQFSNAFQQSTLSDADYAREKLNEQIKEYNTVVTDKVKLSNWYLSEITKINDQEVEDFKEKEEKKRKASKNFIFGMQDSIKSYVEESKDLYAQANTLFTNSMKGMEDALVDFVKTGKLNFSDMIDSMISDIARMMIQQQITSPIASALGSVFGGFTAADATAMNSVPTTFFARGGVVNTPTAFGHSGGLGVMGEAGAEAIMPLQRIGGDMGVKSTPSRVTLNITNNSGNEISAEQISEMTKTNSSGESEKVITIVMDAVSRNKSGIRDMLKGVK